MRFPFCFLCMALAAFLAPAMGCAVEDTASDEVRVLPPPADSLVRVQGVTLDARQAPGLPTLERLRDLGARHLVLVPFGFQPRIDLPEIRHNPESRWYSESDAGIRDLARQADSLGMAVVLKPHVWVGRGDGGEQNWSAIRFETEQAWTQWEAQYRDFVMHYARLSTEIGAPLFCIGTELASAARARPAFWRSLIAEVREVYPGKLTYAANWYEEYEHITFWDALDYIGIQAYFPLGKAENPERRAFREQWKAHCAALLRLHREVNRPILFTEIGYRSVSYAAAEPWRWPSREEQDQIEPDEALQASLYRAFFESVWKEPWFAGAILWKWYPENRPDPARHRLDFTPQDKQAEHVIGAWFRGAP